MFDNGQDPEDKSGGMDYGGGDFDASNVFSMFFGGGGGMPGGSSRRGGGDDYS